MLYLSNIDCLQGNTTYTPEPKVRVIYVSRIALKAVNITIINHIGHLEQTQNFINLTLKLCKMQ